MNLRRLILVATTLSVISSQAWSGEKTGFRGLFLGQSLDAAQKSLPNGLRLKKESDFQYNVDKEDVSVGFIMTRDKSTIDSLMLLSTFFDLPSTISRDEFENKLKENYTVSEFEFIKSEKKFGEVRDFFQGATGNGERLTTYLLQSPVVEVTAESSGSF
ncbi:hypothetical protein [Aminobacter niigataensis]|uniref:hypothetical protein n=1 Tax=Aminobacter niigataensis TaxID=83265 RepID=UPI0024C94C2C|nr:hypothetical protein [Aminobacter niigataensis]CAI2934990.1 protein of unknown function [Aminobacter niigataensis]